MVAQYLGHMYNERNLKIFQNKSRRWRNKRKGIHQLTLAMRFRFTTPIFAFTSLQQTSHSQKRFQKFQDFNVVT
ncbi:hypothetical protein COV06_00320 [Candidatus Uhrbacteria bacterium CG10_big_fil_rev_8_21_14_0_10_50_16]|uniref:Uncharacterized protein n=1 Tax=Candidatus Uhrbacteria bacterium CG10_big_fil_rev_8_21_14_0_10_50_16 TaxID=1975039 RepID=A0A2H0RQ06_9BACT|nr:MAG: hypothetical protein COV06_00320 [Candidatus Uhrbacteria bacterium CG10_big_fil_rev_8_21_14_0_10_50_16]